MTQFITLSNPRCGGILLGTALGLDHPDVLYYGELFHSIKEIRSNEAARLSMSGLQTPTLESKTFALSPWSPTIEQGDYMRSVLSQESSHKAIGFKVHFDQTKISFWQFLEDNPKVKILYLKRDNLFASYASYMKSIATGQWHISGDREQVHEVAQITIDPKNLLKYFEEMALQENKLQPLSNPIFVITYEGMCGNFRETLKEVFRFLELDVISPKKRTLKMTKNYSYIANLDEIVSFFKGSKYESWFENTRA